MRIIGLLFGLLCAVAVVPANAVYTTVTYHGVVSRILDAAEAPGIHFGDLVTYSGTFDPDTAVDVGSTFFDIDGNSGLPIHVPNLNGSQLLGIDVGAIASNGLAFFSDPIAALLHYIPTTGNGSLVTSDDLSFLVTTELDDAIARAVVPEPATWSLIMFGIGGLLFALRRKSARRKPRGRVVR